MKRSTAIVRLYTREEGGSNVRAQKQNAEGQSFAMPRIGLFKLALCDVSTRQESAVRTIRSPRHTEHGPTRSRDITHVTINIQDTDLTPWVRVCVTFLGSRRDCLLVWR